MLTSPLRCLLFIVAGSILLNVSASAAMDDAKFENIKSSVLSGVKYDADSRTLSLRFTNGMINDYLDVPESIYERLKGHFLPGGFYRGYIDGRFETVPVYDPVAEAEAAAAAAEAGTETATAEPVEPAPAEPEPPVAPEPIVEPEPAVVEEPIAPAPEVVDSPPEESVDDLEDTVPMLDEIVLDSPSALPEEQIDELSDEEVFNLIDELEEDSSDSLDAIEALDALVK